MDIINTSECFKGVVKTGKDINKRPLDSIREVLDAAQNTKEVWGSVTFDNPLLDALLKDTHQEWENTAG